MSWNLSINFFDNDCFFPQSDEKGPVLRTHLQQIIDRVHKSVSSIEKQNLQIF